LTPKALPPRESPCDHQTQRPESSCAAALND
jgi:hypothetical protein